MRVGLFVPCYVDAFEPQVGIATLELLERFGLDVVYPFDQTCCGQPMTNTGCHAEAAATEALFVRNFTGFDYVVAPSGSCVHQVREHMTAIEQTPEVIAVRERTFELVEFLHDILKVEAFPWAEFPHKVSYHSNCNALRGIVHAAPSELRQPFFSKPLDLLEKVKGRRTGADCPPGRVLRFRRHFLGVRAGGVGEDGPRQGRRSRPGGGRVCRFGRFVLHDAPARLRRPAWAEAEVHPHRPGSERSDRMNTPPSNGLLHPDLQSSHDEAPKGQDGERLQHAEGTSQPLRPDRREPQPRGAKVHGRRPIDQDEAAARFIAAPEHAKMHDERLWDLRKKRDAQMHAIPEWEELRELASQIKQHTLAHLDHYLEQFEANAKANGIHVHWAVDGAAHNQIVHDILRDHGAKRLIKSKSMLTEECGFRHYMATTGIEVIETDLGERIQQLDNEDPSHVVVPAVHKLRRDVAEVFSRTLGSDPDNDDVAYLANQQREATRPLILSADAGMTGANFAIAETGSFVVCTNEGNADLSANVPPLHIASIGIEKLIPRIEDLGIFIRLLSRSALGSPITQYTSHFRRPREGCRDAHRPGGQWPFCATGDGRILDVAEMHPLRRLHEHLPGVSAAAVACPTARPIPGRSG